MTRHLLTVTGILEAATGTALLVLPSGVVLLLLGAALDADGGATVARVTGAAILALGLTCWFARDDGQTRAGRGVVAAMLVYHVAVAAVLAHAGLVLGMTAIGLWPAMAGHSILAVWSVACLLSARSAPAA
jgi:high-affinity Fe2+/Pb2+ permease